MLPLIQGPFPPSHNLLPASSYPKDYSIIIQQWTAAEDPFQQVEEAAAAAATLHNHRTIKEKVYRILKISIKADRPKT
jgi:hypothetical protein